MAIIQWKTKQELDANNLEQQWQSIRIKRDMLLKESDFTQLPDAPLTEEEKQEIAIYRQTLRDLPENVDIDNPIFPEKPVCLTQ